MFQVIERYAPDLSVRDDDGHTPAIVAADNGHVRLTHYIQDQDAIEVAKVTNPIPLSYTTREFNLDVIPVQEKMSFRAAQFLSY